MTPEKARDIQSIPFSAAEEQLHALCDGIGLREQAARSIEIFRATLGAASAHSGAQAARWSSQVEDTDAPFLCSLIGGSEPRLQFVVEPLAAAPAIAANWQAALPVLAELGRFGKLELARFQRVQELFRPEAGAHFAARIETHILADGARFKLHLDLRAKGKAHSPLTLEKALCELGFTAAWPVIGQRLTRRGSNFDELTHVVLDLSSPEVRLEVHARHRQCSASDLECVLGACKAHRAGDAARFLGLVGAGATPLLTSYEFVEGQRAKPGSVRVQAASGAANALQDCLSTFAVDGQVASTLLQGLARVASHSGDMVSVGVRLGGARAEVSVALAAPNHEGATKARGSEPPPSGVHDIVERYEEWDRITNHPFLHRLRREPVNLHHIWSLLANFQVSISKTFSQRLALIASRVDDPHARYIVTDLLYDEMGSGNFELAHVNLFANMMKVMEPWRPAAVEDWMLAAGANFNVAMDKTYGSPDVYEALGAVISGEIFGKQFDQFLGDEVRRQDQVDPALFVWITLHESLEETHADEGADLAKLIPEHALDAAARGAYGLAVAAWAFLTDVYEICYGERAS